MGNRKFFFLYPISLLYGLITYIRNILYDTGILKSKKFSIPVICVGNITVGGTGKTPHTEYLACLLQDKFKVAILSRGYKRKSHGFRIVSKQSTTRDTGDESLQISNKFPGIIVAVDRDRINGVQTIIKKFPETAVVILDDGFQHRRINPGISILLTDYNRLLTRDYLMPYGRLRENRKNIRRAQIIVVTKCPHNISLETMEGISKEIGLSSSRKIFFSAIYHNDPLPVFENGRYRQLSLAAESPEERGIVLVTGIATPGPLAEHLRKHFNEIKHIEFPDHHYFDYNDIEVIRRAWDEIRSSEKYLITTEKDAVRLREIANIADHLKEAFYYIPVRIDFLHNSRTVFDNLIIDYVGKNKRND